MECQVVEREEEEERKEEEEEESKKEEEESFCFRINRKEERQYTGRGRRVRIRQTVISFLKSIFDFLNGLDKLQFFPFLISNFDF